MDEKTQKYVEAVSWRLIMVLFLAALEFGFLGPFLIIVYKTSLSIHSLKKEYEKNA